jgi:3-mercaptopyruvate sulfurtransferase SseA
LIGGHIPGSLNIPSDLLLDTKTGLFKSDAQLRQVFAAAGVDVGPGCKPVIASCGSGVTACVLLYGLHLLGMRRYHLYDGSWSEWYAIALNIPYAMRQTDLLISIRPCSFFFHARRGIPALKLPIESNKKL